MKWIFERCSTPKQSETIPEGVDTAIGLVPRVEDLDLNGLQLSDEALATLFEVDAEKWRAEAASIRAHFATFGEHLPFELRGELESLEARLAQ